MSNRAQLVGIEGQCYIECRDGSVLELLAVATAGGPLNLQALAAELSHKPRLLA